MPSADNIPCSCDEPSGHSSPRPIPTYDIPPTRPTSRDYKTDYSSMPNFRDFGGPYKDHHPPGSRSPAVGEKDWGDAPYLPSYLDRMYFPKEPTGGPPDNLYFRGPFYRGVSETHAEYVNRGVPPPREYHTYTRHYQEPGLKDERSVTQTDFGPPHPMLPGDKAPCLAEDPPKPWYEPDRKPPKNTHAKEVEARPQQTGVVFVDDEDEWDLSTEHGDNYVCYQGPKAGSKIRNPAVKREEIFLKNMRRAHQECTHPDASRASGDARCDGLPCRTRQRCPGFTPRTESWLLHPKNYAFRNGAMLIPCECRRSRERLRECVYCGPLGDARENSV